MSIAICGYGTVAFCYRCDLVDNFDESGLRLDDDIDTAGSISYYYVNAVVVVIEAADLGGVPAV